MANVPADCVWGADNVTVAALPGDMKWYGGYWNGPYANMTALAKRFPAAFKASIAVRFAGSRGSTAVDAEPGTLAPDQGTNFADTLAWIRQGGQPGKPWVYTMASWAQPMVDYLAAHGVARSSYILWTAHYTGQHLCGPGGCGYLTSPADITQYATGYNDYNVARGYAITGGGGKDTFQTTGLKLGDTDANTDGQVHGIQNQLNTWAKFVGFAPLVVDGDFGGKTFNAVRMFQLNRKLTADPLGTVGIQTENNLKTPPGVIKKVVAVVKTVPKAALPSGTPALKLGDTGKAVAQVQYYLRNSGIFGVRGIEADGDFGPATNTSLRNFQAYAHLTVDGVYGPATAKALAKVAVA